MRKAAHLLGGMDSSNPHHLRGERLHHHDDVVCRVVFAFCVVSSGRPHSSYVDKYERSTLNRNTPIRVRAGTKNYRPVGFLQ